MDYVRNSNLGPAAGPHLESLDKGLGLLNFEGKGLVRGLQPFCKAADDLSRMFPVSLSL